MSLSPIAFFGLLDENNPVGTDSRTISDDQHRNILASMKQQAPNWTGAINSTHQDMNLLSGFVAAGQRIMPGIGGTTVCFFYNATPPTGWFINQVDTEQPFLAIAPVQPTVPGVYGTDPCEPLDLPTTVINVSVDLPANTGGHTLTANQSGLRSHTHPVTTVRLDTSSDDEVRAGTGAASDQSPGTTLNSASLDAIDAHSHTIGGTAAQSAGSGSGSTTTFDPKRAVGVLGRLQT